jgi:hypothetical protein
MAATAPALAMVAAKEGSTTAAAPGEGKEGRKQRLHPVTPGEGEEGREQRLHPATTVGEGEGGREKRREG